MRLACRGHLLPNDVSDASDMNSTLWECRACRTMEERCACESKLILAQTEEGRDFPKRLLLSPYGISTGRTSAIAEVRT
jgi:hypothetical protein